MVTILKFIAFLYASLDWFIFMFTALIELFLFQFRAIFYFWLGRQYIARKLNIVKATGLGIWDGVQECEWKLWKTKTWNFY